MDRPSEALHVACSWSGGKDSAPALQLAIDQRLEPRALFTMLDESGERSRSHGLPLSVLEAQASRLRLPLISRSAAWADYTEAFIDGLREAAALGCRECVFGDIDIESHRRWCEAVSARAALGARHPLWQRDRRDIVEEFLARGFSATIVVVRDRLLDRSFLGRQLDACLISELEAAGLDACGENGEFHTLVTSGPLFSQPLVVQRLGVHAVADCGVLQIAPLPGGHRSSRP